MNQYILAHDLGTSGDKATLFTTDGHLEKSVIASYPTRYQAENHVEQEPEDWYEAVCRSTRELLTGIDPAAVIGISFSGHMMGAVLLGRDGQVLRPALIWADQRAVEQRDAISAQVGDEQFYRITGTRNNPTTGLAKLLWVCENEHLMPAKLINCKDYIAYRLTGELGTDYSDASGTGAFDLNQFDWSDEILEAMGLSRAVMPELQASVDLVGTVTAEAARASGLLVGTPVFRGCGDGTAATVGAGVTHKGECYCCLGSSAWVACVDDSPLLDKEMRTFNLAGIQKGSVFPIGTMQAAGVSYNWMRDELCQREQLEAERDGKDIYDCINSQIAQVPFGANGVIYLPYLLGERSPWWDDRAKGAFLGLQKSTTHADMLRAVMEGISYNLALNLAVLRQRHQFREIRVMGGCAKEVVWRQILADMFGLPVQKLSHLDEACSMGAAVVAGIGAGVFTDSGAVAKFVQTDGLSVPQPDAAEFYENQLGRFAESYRRLQGLF